MSTYLAAPEGEPAALLREVLDESKRMRADAQAKEARQRRTNQLVAGGIVVLLVLVLGNLILLLQSRQRGIDSRRLIATTASTSQRIADCTTKGGRCYEEGSRRQADAIRQLIDAQTEIAVCQRRADSEAALRACVRSALEQLAGPAPSLSPSAQPSPSP